MALEDASLIERAMQHSHQRRAEQEVRAAPVPTTLPARRRTDHPRRRRGDVVVPERGSFWLMYLSNIVSALLGAGLMYLTLNGLRPTPAESVKLVSSEPVVAPAVESRQPAAPIQAETTEVPKVQAPAPAVDLQAQAYPVIEHWRQAWSARDIDQYLASYSDNFVPADGASRAAWAEARRKNFASRDSIAVSVRGLTAEADGEDAIKVYFQQDYASGRYRESGQWKTLVLQREDAGWRIVAETQSGPG